MSSFTNYPNNSDTYLPPVIQIPSTLLISSISQGFPAILVATVPVTGQNTYIPGQKVRLNIPYPYGMQQAAGRQVNILAVSGLTFTLDMNSSLFDPFVTPSGNVSEPASMAPAGSQNLQISNTTNQVPFQSFNNVGN